MATAKRGKSTRVGGVRRYRRTILVFVLIACAIGAWWWSALVDQATAASAYGARIACSCRFVAGRSLDDCEKDMLPGMEAVMLSEDAEAKSITARVPLLARQSAIWSEGPGCMLERWDD